MQIDPFSAKKITNKQNLTCIEKNSENLIKSLNPSTNTKMTVHKNQLYILYGAVPGIGLKKSVQMFDH